MGKYQLGLNFAALSMAMAFLGLASSTTFAASLNNSSRAPILCEQIFNITTSVSSSFKLSNSRDLSSQWQELASRPDSALKWLEENSEPFQEALSQAAKIYSIELKPEMRLSDLIRANENRPNLPDSDYRFLQDFTNRLRYLMYQIQFVKDSAAPDSALLARLVLERLSYHYFWNYNKFTFSDPNSRRQWKKLKYPLYADNFHFPDLLATAISKRYQRKQNGSNRQGPATLADHVHDLGWNYLIHSTNIEKLIPILQANQLRRANGKNLTADIDESSYGTSSFAQVFFEAIGYARSGEPIAHYRLNEFAAVKTKITSLILVFDLDLFNMKKYVFSNAWIYGEFITGLSARSDSAEQVLDIMSTSASGKLTDQNEAEAAHNELAISENVPLTYLKEIWVEPSTREQILKQLHAAKFDKINGIPVERFVVAKSAFD